MPLTITYKSLQAFVIFNYQRLFIENYALHAQPLYELLELKNIPKNFIKKNGLANGKYILEWTPKEIDQFELMKQLNSDTLELFHPDFRFPMNVRSDASDKGYGGYLFQDVEGQVPKTSSRIPVQNLNSRSKELLGRRKRTPEYLQTHRRVPHTLVR